MKQWSKIIEQCDTEIRAGRSEEAARLLAGMNTAKIPREWRLPLAKICRRSGLYVLGMRLLVPCLDDNASPGELAEYAALLLRYGAVTEALERLYEIDGAVVPEVLLFRAFGHFGRWEFSEAIPHLKSYLNSPLAPYANLVGRTNLAFALVESRQHAPALELIENLIQEVASEGHHQLQSNCHALAGQVFLQDGDFSRARKEFEKAERLIRTTKTNDRFLVTKMNLILAGLEQGSQKPFEKIRTLATERRDWVALREADLFSLKVNFDQRRFVHLFFGTPYEGFRKIMEAVLSKTPDRSVYVLGQKTSPRFDLESGTIEGIEIDSAGGKCHQLIEILLRDFYEPSRLGGLFTALFPGERFNIISSPDRVHQIISRTRRWLSHEKIPVKVLETDGFYSLEIEGDFSFRVPLQRRPVNIETVQLKKIKDLFSKTTSFSAKEASEKLGISLASTQRLLNSSINGGDLLRIGTSKRSAAYKLAG